MTMTFFTHSKVQSGITRIAGAIGEFMYLIEGSERSLLIDTGCGLGNIHDYVSNLTDLPLTVAITHGHYDHCGGMYTYPEVWIPDGELIPSEVAYSFAKGRNVADTRGFDVEDSEIVHPGDIIFHTLKAGKLFDLGGVTVEAISCPGHTPNTMTFLVMPYRLLLTGDACHSITYMHFSTALPLNQYKKSLEILLEREDEWDHLLLSHATGESNKNLIHEMLERVQEVISDTAERVEPFDNTGKHFVASKAGQEGKLLYRIDNIVG